MSLASGNTTLLDLFDSAGLGTYAVTLPVVAPAADDSSFFANISVPNNGLSDADEGAADDTAYQIARAYSDDYDGDGEDDTVAYAAIVIPSIGYESDGEDSSAHVIAGLLLGVNVSDDETLTNAGFTNVADYFGDETSALIADTAPEDLGTAFLAAALDGKFGIAIGRKADLTDTTDSASGARTDSGQSVQVLPVGLIGATSYYQAAEAADTNPATNTTATWVYGDVAFASCYGNQSLHTYDNKGTLADPTDDDCTTTLGGDATTHAYALAVNAIAAATAQASSYISTSGLDQSGDGISFSDDADAMDLADATDATPHSVEIDFDQLSLGRMRISIRLIDADHDTATVVVTDTLLTTIAGDASTDVQSTNYTQAVCNSSTDLGGTFSDLDVDPYLFSTQNVFGDSSPTCQNVAEAAVTLSDGNTLADIMGSATYNGYAVSFGFVAAAALNPALTSTEAAATFTNVVTAAGGQTPTISGIVVEAD